MPERGRARGAAGPRDLVHRGEHHPQRGEEQVVREHPGVVQGEQPGEVDRRHQPEEPRRAEAGEHPPRAPAADLPREDGGDRHEPGHHGGEDGRGREHAVPEQGRVRLVDQVVDAHGAMLVWEFSFRVRRWGGGQAQLMRGVSHLRFAADGKVDYHRDYWDTGEELYMKLPGLGTLLRGLRRLLAA